MNKTNKSFTKRIKVTGTGKLIRRKSGQNHFNARNSGEVGRQKHGKRSVASVDAIFFTRNAPFNR